MKTFIIIAEQGGGCDYTIGCGVKYWFEYGNSIKEVREEVEARLLDESEDGDYCDYDLTPDRLRTGLYSEGSYDSLEIYELGPTHYTVPLTKLVQQLKDKWEADRVKEIDDSEKAKYEELKKKFDPKFKPKPKSALNKVCSTCGKDFKTKQKNEEDCKSCTKIAKKEVEEQLKISMQQMKIRNSILKALSDNGWRTNPMFGERQNGGIKVDNFGLIYFYDDLRMKGTKKTYTWRRGTLDEARKFFPDEVIKIFEDNRWLAV